MVEVRALREALRLDRPLVVLDVETTGTNPETDRIVSFALVRIEMGAETETINFRCNPEQPIPPEASAIHGITDADVATEPPFRRYAKSLAAKLEGCDLAGFNLKRFDLRILDAEFRRAGVPFSLEGRRILDACVLFHQREPRDLPAAVRFYCDTEHVGAHDALADVHATCAVLAAQVSRYELPRDCEALHALCCERQPNWVSEDGKVAWRNGAACLTFGKLDGVPLQTAVATERGYLEWMLSKSFAPDVKDIIRAALAGEFPQPPNASVEVR